MRVVRWLIGFLVFAGALLFAVQNTDLATVRFYHVFSWQTPLIVLLLAAFALGSLAGLLATFARVMRLRRQILRLRQIGRRASDPIEPPAAPGA